ncbi:MAG: hypothetical protein U0807_19050 [Candidatus Binatia bacterium]
MKTSTMGRLAFAAALAAVAPALACDVCAIYTATAQREGRTGLRLGVAEQYTHFGTLQQDGEEVDNPADERVDSAITQLVAGYQLMPRFGVQANLPIIARTYRRVEGERVVEGSENGVGDLVLSGTVLAYSLATEQSVLRLSLLGGIKLPTGDAHRLGEEAGDEPHMSHMHMMESGVHGHDLALGSGSVDGIVGGGLFWSWRRAFVTAAAQYAIRSTGDFDYRFANDLTWVGGPGVYVLLDHRYTLGLQAVVSGETKGKDEQNGVRADDTAITALYVGPGLSFTWGTSLGADLSVDVPAVQNNTALQIVPDVRVRGGVVWTF